MTAIARRVALELVRRVAEDDSYANLLLPKLVGKYNLDSRDAALAQEIAFGAIRQKKFLDAVIERAAQRQASAIDSQVLQVLQLGAYQLLFTRIPKHAAINETVEQAKSLSNGRLSGFANAVMRRVSERSYEAWLDLLTSGLDAASALELKYSHPGWVIAALKLALVADKAGEELESTLASNNLPAKVNLVALPGLAASEDTGELQPTDSSPIGFISPSGNPTALDGYKSGHLRVQDAGSQLVALCVLQAKPVVHGEKWLDMCAGPGGKATLLAALAKESEATLVCNEPLKHRAQLVEDALKASGLHAEISLEDGRDLIGTYDRILLDAPCSGLGALRRRPEARWRKLPSDIPALAKLQLELVLNAWNILKPGGVLVYATCSPHPAETTAIIDQLLKRVGENAELIDAPGLIKQLSPNIPINTTRKTAQLWPHRNETDAMFIAVLRKSVS